jgi:hypothetical protein
MLVDGRFVALVGVGIGVVPVAGRVPGVAFGVVLALTLALGLALVGVLFFPF